MSSEEFLAFGEEKSNALLKEQGAPPNFSAEMLIKMVKSGQVDPKKMAEMMEKMPKRPGADEEEHPDAYILKWADASLPKKGFVEWTPFQHPTLGAIEIGGFAPYLRIVPPPGEAEKTIAFHTDFYIGLMRKLPGLRISKTEVTSLGP